MAVKQLSGGKAKEEKPVKATGEEDKPKKKAKMHQEASQDKEKKRKAPEEVEKRPKEGKKEKKAKVAEGEQKKPKEEDKVKKAKAPVAEEKKPKDDTEGKKLKDDMAASKNEGMDVDAEEDKGVKGAEAKEVKAEDPMAVDNFELCAGIKSLLRSKGIDALFPIQAQTLGIALEGIDVVGRARTGCGKTLAFVLPIVERLVQERIKAGGRPAYGRKPSVIALCPTRELAKQVGLPHPPLPLPSLLKPPAPPLPVLPIPCALYRSTRTLSTLERLATSPPFASMAGALTPRRRTSSARGSTSSWGRPAG